MNFNTHQEIDNHYRSQGLNVDRLQHEFEQVKFAMLDEQKQAIYFLKKRMGKIRYSLWRFFGGGFMSAGFGKDGFIEKAKEYGFKDRSNEVTRTIMEESSESNGKEKLNG